MRISVPEPEWRVDDIATVEPPPEIEWDDPRPGFVDGLPDAPEIPEVDLDALEEEGAPVEGSGLAAERSPGREVGKKGKHTLLDLNLEQLEAVETRGPVMVEAPPGSGKTRTLAGRVCRILEHAAPQSILAVTFTKLAAAEMRDQVRAVVGDAADQANIGTLHSVGYGIVRSEADRLGLSKEPDVASPSYAGYLLRKAAKQAGLDQRWDLTMLGREIERAKGEAIGPDEYRVHAGDFYSHTVAKVYAGYQELLREKCLVDFGDMLRLAVKALEINAETRGFYQSLYRYVLVDEWQDTNTAQYRLVRALVGRETDLFVVGDPWQSIYGWRGADPRIFERLAGDLGGVSHLQLRVNYRNTEVIASAAEAVMGALGLSSRNMEALGGGGEPLRLSRCETERDEALRVAEEICRLAELGDCGYNDCAVLVRTVRQARLIEQAFLRNQVPYTLAGHQGFFKTRVIRGLVAWLRLAANAFDEGGLEAALNAPPRGLGKATRGQLRGGAFRLSMEVLLMATGRDDLPEHVRNKVAEFLQIVDDVHKERGRRLPALLDFIVERTGYRAWLRKAGNGYGSGNGNGNGNGLAAGDFPATSDGDNVRELRIMLEGYRGEGALEKFLDDLDAMHMETEAARGVFLGTIHSSKGLEWPVVFLPGLDEGVLPHAKSVLDKRRLEEEHRLFYVALTRAMRKVYLLGARYRTNARGQAWETNPSRFLSYLPEDAVRRV